MLDIDYYPNLHKELRPNKAIVILGPCQVGKTTLLRQFMAKTKLRYKLAPGDELSVQQALSIQNLRPLVNFIGANQVLIIDEAQRVPNIGINIKIIVDNISGIHVIATGSSSFDLAGQVGEPLVGRKINLNLYPISQLELSKIRHPLN